MIRTRNLGRLVVWGAALVPLALWLGAGLPVQHRGTSSPFLMAAGQIAGLTGMALLSLSFLLSARFRFLEDYFGGLDAMYRLHHTLGLTAFTLLCLHPLALAARFLPDDLNRTLLFLLPTHERLSINLGVFALWGLIGLIALTLYRRIPYDKWKITHKALSVVLLLGTLHMLTTESTRGQDVVLTRFPALRYYMTGLAILGLIAATYKTALLPLLSRRHWYSVTGVRRMNEDVIEITLTPERGAIDFFPGQFIFVTFYGDGLTRESHPFTVCTPAGQSTLKLTVKALGDFTSALYQHLAPGMQAKVEGPYGRFDYRNGSHRQIWIAGGVGIAPFLSWIRHMTHIGDRTYHIDFYYCVHSRSDAVYHDELAALSDRLPHLHLALICSVEQGHLHARDIANVKGRDIFLCGPKRLTQDMHRQFRRRGVPDERLHFEDFEFR